MKITFKVFYLILLFASTCLAGDKRQSGRIIMPRGMENVYPGMPMTELLKARPRLESGTDWLQVVDKQGIISTWLNDPNDPRKIDINAIKNIEATWPAFSYKWPNYGHHFKEKAEIPLLEITDYFFSEQPRLLFLEIKGFTGTRKEIKEFSRNRDKLIEQLIQKWGKPKKVLIGEYRLSGAYYAIGLEWEKGDVFMEMQCPLVVEEYVKSISLFQKLLGKLLGIDGVQTRLLITDDSRIKWRQQDLYSYPSYFKPVGAEEMERLLKSIKYYEILEQSLKTQNSNQAVGGR